MMIKKQSIKIGPIEIDSPVILAPMSGVTDFPFRQTVRKFGSGLVVTEMIASREMVRNMGGSRKMETLEDEPPISVQLAGTEPETMAQAARMNEARGADIIDINMGCPVKKVVKSYAGSALMRDEDLACRIMEAVKNAVSIPVTVKMRLGWDESNLNAPKLAKRAEEIGLSAVTVHGRTRTQMYKGHADWLEIARVKQAVDIPVIGNGDICTYQDIEEIFDQSDVDAIMIGRGVYGRPWFINQAMDFVKTGKVPDDPDLDIQCDTVLSHYNHMLDYYGEHVGVRHARKHLSWYVNGLHGASECRNKIMSLKNPDDVRCVIKDIYNNNIGKKVA